MTRLRVAALQHDVIWENKAANFERLAPGIRGAVEEGARLVVLSEMFSTGFSMNTVITGEPPDGPSTRFLREQAAEHGVWVGGSVPERPAGEVRPFNRFVLAAPDGTVHRYAKRRLFAYAGEHEHFQPGSAPLVVEIEGVRCALAICYDLRFAPDFWEVATRTDAYLVPANWPVQRREHWRALLRARAIENQAYLVGVNRVGSGGRLTYVGDSAIIDPAGTVLGEAAEGEALLVADIDTDRVVAVRDRFPFLADR